jgi:hypothetical protein
VRRRAAPGSQSAELLADPYADALAAEFDLVSRFAVDPSSRNRYCLFFGTDQLDGLRAMKAASWNVDPEGGRGYCQDILVHHDQGELFSAVVRAPRALEEARCVT